MRISLLRPDPLPPSSRVPRSEELEAANTRYNATLAVLIGACMPVCGIVGAALAKGADPLPSVLAIATVAAWATFAILAQFYSPKDAWEAPPTAAEKRRFMLAEGGRMKHKRDLTKCSLGCSLLSLISVAWVCAAAFA